MASPARIGRRGGAAPFLSLWLLALPAGPSPGADCVQPLDEETIRGLDLFAWRTSVRPGGSIRFNFGVMECCYFWRGVPACVEWSIDPPGAGTLALEDLLDPFSAGGQLQVAPAVLHGTVITVQASVESGRRVLEEQFHVYTEAGNPLVGRWEEAAQVTCGGGFVRGDLDGNGSLEVTDPINFLSYQFQGGPAPTCREAADANGDRALDLSDAAYSLNHQFLGGPAPPEPFPGCGAAPDPAFGCLRSPACAGSEAVPEPAINELIFEADGSFSVTWFPFELYKDYWGTYAFDQAAGTIQLRATGGNNVPPDLRGEAGTFSIAGNRLRLEDLWLGSQREGAVEVRCGHVFERR